MLFNIILLFIVLYVLSYLLTYSKSFKEQYVDVPVLAPEHTNFVEKSNTKLNPLTSMINLTNPAFPVTPETSQQMMESIAGITAEPVADGHNLIGSTLFNIPKQLPDVLRNAGVCQKAPNNCSAFDNPEFANNCGMSFDVNSKDANGQPHVGGLYLSNDDRVQQTRMFKEVEDTGSEPYDPYKVYQPTLGTATPGTFGITKDSCMVVKEKVDCSTKQTFNSPNCTQCYTSQTFSRVDPKTGRLPSTLFLFGRGKVSVSGVINLNGFFDLSETRDIQMTIPADAEGKNFLITVNADGSPPTYLAGYLEGTTARGTFKIDLITLIQADTQTSAKPKMNGTKKVNGFRCYSMVPASGKSQMTLACLMPFSFINMFDGDALACDNGPIITKESSATFLQSDPCFGPKNSPGNYTKDCLQSRWLSMNGTQDGTGYPTDAATMDKLQKNADGSPRDLDTIVDGMVGVVNKALTGKNDAGQMLSIPEWNDASMYVTGVPINTPCDGPGSQPPLSQQCLSYLYANQGNGGRIGSTYTMPPGKYASALQEGFEVEEGFAQVVPNTYNQPSGTLNPNTLGGLQAGQEMGGVENVKNTYDSVNRLANDNTKKNVERATAVQQAYGVSLKPLVVSKNDWDVRVPIGVPTKTYRDMQNFCESQGKRLCESTEICDKAKRVVRDPELTSEFPGDNWIAVGDKPNEWLTLNRGGDRYCKTHTEVAGGVPGWGDSREPVGWERLAKCCGGDKTILGRYIRFQYDHVECLNLTQLTVYTDENESSQIVRPDMVVTKPSGYQGDMFPSRNFVDGVGQTFVHTSCYDVPWVMVDLGAITQIYRVVLTNRYDCCKERVLGTTMIILDEQFKPVYNSAKIVSVNQVYVWFPPSTTVYPDYLDTQRPNPGYVSVGCWKDTWDRAIPTLEGTDPLLDGDNYKARQDAINKCYQAAKAKGMGLFAVQDGGWCAASNSRSGYQKYGAANNCEAGKGGGWANNVYEIADITNNDRYPPKQNIYGNNGTTTCERYCSGVGGGSWNNELPAEWNGASCVGHSSDIKDCYSRFNFQPGVSSCTCKQTGGGWRQGGWMSE